MVAFACPSRKTTTKTTKEASPLWASLFFIQVQSAPHALACGCDPNRMPQFGKMIGVALVHHPCHRTCDDH